MSLPAKILVSVLFATQFLAGYTQDKKPSSTDISSLFDDLPIADPSANSILQKNENASEKIRKNIFIKAIVNKRSVYKGESVLASYKLFTSLNSKTHIITKPGLGNFNSLEFETLVDSTEQKLISGKNYRVFTLWQAEISPMVEGPQSIDPIVVDNVVTFVGGDKLTHTYSGITKSDILEISVMALPANGKPLTFDGVVGKFGIITSLQKSSIATGEKNVLHIEITGNGNFSYLSLPTVSWPIGTEYSPFREAFLPDKNRADFGGKKIFDIPFVSEKTGRFVIPSLSISFFDPKLVSYYSVSSKPLDLEVLQGSGANLGSQTVAPNDVSNKRFSIYVNIGIVAAMFVVLAIALKIVSFVRKKREIKRAAELELIRIAAEVEAEKQRKATELKEKIDNIAMIQNDELYTSEVRMLLIRLMQEKLNSDIPLEENLIDLLLQQTNDNLLVHEMHDAFAVCGKLLYSPSNQSEIRLAISNSVSGIIHKLELISNS